MTHDDRAAPPRDSLNTRIYTAEEDAEYVSTHNPQPPAADPCRASYWAGRRKEQARVEAIVAARSRRKDAAA